MTKHVASSAHVVLALRAGRAQRTGTSAYQNRVSTAASAWMVPTPMLVSASKAGPAPIVKRTSAIARLTKMNASLPASLLRVNTEAPAQIIDSSPPRLNQS